MQGTRDHVLEFIVQHREVRVEELASALGVTTAAVRRHLDHLRADGLVDMRAVKQATGRPYYAYHPTERALGSLPDGYASILERVLRSVDGQEDVAERMAESVAQRHRGEMRGAVDEQLIVQVTESLRPEGILESWHAEHDGYHLVNGTCPYLKAAEFSSLPCESDRKAIELLLGRGVTQLNRIVDGAATCEYLVLAQTERESTKQGAS
jgi:predicted ArsR family transcriptional regulator